jgi:tripeptide aminopeptidase
VSEEDGLHGAKAFDVSRLRSEYGYVMDHASAIGEIVTASPTYHKIVAEFRGRAAHAGIRPEEGRSAIAAAAAAIASMRLGRLDQETTANVGTIAGGTATNVVPELCALEAEVRSLDDRRAEEVATELVDHLQDAANAAECDLDVTVEQMFKGYRSGGQARELAVAERALAACGYEPRRIVTGGGSDANALQASGFPCANLANGTERNHEPGERVSIEALEGMLDVALALVEEAAAESRTSP